MAKVGIDIGHGENTYESGGGKGVKVDGIVYEEHHFNSAVGQIVDKRLKELGFQTYMAQKPFSNDVYLGKRTSLYNSQDVDLIVSIHANAGVKSANGACIFSWTGNSRTAKFAKNWTKNFKEMVDGVDLHGNGTHISQKGSWTNFHIIREPKADSVLIEHGFMTNNNDFEYIFGDHKDEYIPQVAEAIVKTVCEHFGVTYKEAGQPVKVSQPNVDGKHKVQKGDTFYSIGRKYGVTVQDLQRANPKVNARALQIGSYIVIPEKEKPQTKPTPKKKPNMTTNSIVTYLNSIGVDSSYGNRAKLAVKYGIKGYRGTGQQNLLLLDRMRKGWKAPKGDQKTNSIVDYLVSIKVDSSFANRKKLAVKHGIKNYSGTEAQNLLLLKKIRGH